MATLSQRSFAGGELTPSLYSRTDVSKYSTSLRTCRNYQVLKHGGATQRAGTKFVGEVSDSSAKVRLIPFVFSLTDTYVLEMGNLYVRFIKNGSYITEAAQNITAITNADPGVVTVTGHGYSNGDEVFITGVGGMTELNGRNFKVNNVTANTFELQDMDSNDFDTTSLGAYTSGGTAAKIYEVTTTATTANLFELNYVQSADVMTFVNQTVGRYDLTRISDTNWTWAVKPVNELGSLSGPAAAVSGAAGTTAFWVVAAVDSDGREGLPGTSAGASTVPSSGTPRTVTWSAVTGATFYRVYRKDLDSLSDSVYGFVAEVKHTGTNSFVDNGVVPDYDDNPTNERELGYKQVGTTVAAVTYYQQRIVYANSTSFSDGVIASEIGDFEDFYLYNNPVSASNPLSFFLSGRQVNAVKHMLDLNGLILFTEGSEVIAQGDVAGVLTPTDINLRTQSYHGIGDVPPLVIDNTAIFVQARGSIIRDFSFSDSIGGYSGGDLTIFSTHLFEDYTIDDWTYQKVPNSTVWAVRSDGTLLGMTYLREQELIAWHRHDFDGGVVESVAAIPEGNEDVLYVSVRRTINGSTRRYVERMDSLQIDDIEDVRRMDSYLSYDGTNTTATTMTMSGGTTWAYDETITLTASTSYFVSSDVGKEVHITGTDGTVIKFNIEAFTSGTVVTGKPQITVPVAMRNTAFTTWGKALQTVTGLWHLEGKDVSSFSDGFVTSSPNNASYDTLTVTNGSITLDDHHVVIHVGLPYIADIETLDIDSTETETGRNKKHIVNNVSMFVENTRGLWVGPKPPSDDSVDPLEDLYEVKLRDTENQDEPIDLKTEVIDVNIKAEWNSNGRVFIRQVDPVPSTILSIMPKGNFTLR